MEQLMFRESNGTIDLQATKEKQLFDIEDNVPREPPTYSILTRESGWRIWADRASAEHFYLTTQLVNTQSKHCGWVIA